MDITSDIVVDGESRRLIEELRGYLDTLANTANAEVAEDMGRAIKMAASDLKGCLGRYRFTDLKADGSSFWSGGIYDLDEAWREFADYITGSVWDDGDQIQVVDVVTGDIVWSIRAAVANQIADRREAAATV